MKTLKKLITLALCTVAVWVIASFTEVNMQNTSKYPHYSSWNCFYMMIESEVDY